MQSKSDAHGHYVGGALWFVAAALAAVGAFLSGNPLLLFGAACFSILGGNAFAAGKNALSR